MDLKKKLKKCFFHLKCSPIFGHPIIVLLLIGHLILGYSNHRLIPKEVKTHLRVGIYVRKAPLELSQIKFQFLFMLFLASDIFTNHCFCYRPFSIISGSLQEFPAVCPAIPLVNILRVDPPPKNWRPVKPLKNENRRVKYKKYFLLDLFLLVSIDGIMSDEEIF